MRPKSIATVVVFFVGVSSRPSTPSDASVTNASVRSGMISDTAPTKVVLPDPNPPEMTIFVDRVARLSEPLKATEHPPQECGIAFVPGGVRGGQYLDEAKLHHVRDDHTSNPER